MASELYKEILATPKNQLKERSGGPRLPFMHFLHDQGSERTRHIIAYNPTLPPGPLQTAAFMRAYQESSFGDAIRLDRAPEKRPDIRHGFKLGEPALINTCALDPEASMSQFGYMLGLMEKEQQDPTANTSIRIVGDGPLTMGPLIVLEGDGGELVGAYKEGIRPEESYYIDGEREPERLAEAAGELGSLTMAQELSLPDSIALVQGIMNG